MWHPSEAQLALYSGGDNALYERIWIRAHTARCAECRDVLTRFSAARAAAKDHTLEQEIPGWASIEREMRANIRLGLEAGECVPPVRTRHVVRGWVLAPALASAVLIAGAGLWVRHAGTRDVSRFASGTVLEATTGAIEMRQGGRMLSLRHAASADENVTVSAGGEMSVRYVDSHTGNVTVNHVISE